jgi:lysozyme family protein
VSAARDPFDLALALLLRHEGGYGNDPNDPGGETKFGISKRAYPSLDIRALTEAEAAAIYRRDYWDALRCDALPPALAVCLFDCAVNQGEGAAVRLLQRALGAKEDGVLGPATLRLGQAAQPSQIDDFMARRAKRYAEHPRVSIYGLGWFRRLMAVHRLATTL